MTRGTSYFKSLQARKKTILMSTFATAVCKLLLFIIIDDVSVMFVVTERKFDIDLHMSLYFEVKNIT